MLGSKHSVNIRAREACAAITINAEAFGNVTFDKSTGNVTLSENKVYGIPICAIFRRNSNVYVDRVSPNNTPNQNGAVNRTPSSQSSADSSELINATLTSPLAITTVGNVNFTNLVGSGLDDNNLFSNGNRFFVLGDGINKEIIKVASVSQTQIEILERGVGGTQAKWHNLNTICTLYNGRSDNKYSDEIHSEDLLDMRHATKIGE